MTNHRRGVAIAAAIALTAALAAGCSAGGDHSQPPTIPAGSTSVPPTGPGLASNAATGRPVPPTWPVPDHEVDHITAAGLRPLSQEGAAEHYHAHLDVLYYGSPVTVPAGIGIDVQAQKISPLHTHDDTGLVHIEAAKAGLRYTLGQLFTEWHVRLTAGCIAGYCTDSQSRLLAFVDGKLVRGDPAKIVIRAHDEIALWYGLTDTTPVVPSSYAFPPGA